MEDNLKFNDMNNQKTTEELHLITEIYEKSREMLVGYVAKRINDHDEAEDMVQNAFIRLLEFQQMISEATVQSFVFTVLNHLLIDYYRRHAKRTEMMSYVYDSVKRNNSVSIDTQIYMRNLAETEIFRMNQLPPQRRKIYYMSRFEDKNTTDIAQELHLSVRTVDTHLLLGRRDVRNYLKAVGCLDV